MPETDVGVPGPPTGPEARAIDEPRVTDWFVAHVQGVVPPLTFAEIAGGRSNPTFQVADQGGRTFALRRPPLGHILPTAHDMAREHRILTALGPTPVPVPRTYDLCLDETVNGRPFYVMEFVEGHVLRDAATAEASFSPASRPTITAHLVEALATLHEVDVDVVGLGDLGRKEGYVERQLRRWSTQYASSVASGDQDRLVIQVAELLAGSVPAEHGATIVHGDYRLDNVVLDDAGRVRAILDWEICTLGDPLADVGTLLMNWTEPGEDAGLRASHAPSTLPGFGSRSELLAQYAKASGRDVSDAPYFIGFAYWRMACILQGVYTRYIAGAGGGDPSSVEGFMTTIHFFAERAADALESRR